MVSKKNELISSGVYRVFRVHHRTVSPSLRVGYMVLPEKLVSLFREKVGFYSCSVPAFEQYVLAELLKNGEFERHINRVRRRERKLP